jgi:sugar transferase (PEP-CTERM system associated)
MSDRLRSRAVGLGIAAIDALVVALAYLLATGIRFWGDFQHLDATDLPQQAAIVTFLMIAGLARADAYELERVRNGQELLTRIVLGAFSGFLLIMFGSYVAPAIAPGRGVFAIHAVLTVAFLLLWRRFVFRLMRESALRPRAVVLGERRVARKVARAISEAAFGGAEVVGILTPPPAPPDDGAGDVAGDYARLRAVVLERNASLIVVVAGASDRDLPVDEIVSLRCQGTRVEDGSAVFEGLTGKLLIEKLTPGWLVFANAFERSPLTTRLRGIVGALIALAGLAVLSPLLALVAIAIKLESRGPVLYRQTRVGEGGRTFEILKFRSMRQDAEAGTGAVWAGENDPRVTRVGRFIRSTRIDELPQLWNVVRGDMYFVGPRPERPEFVEKLRKEIPFYDHRHTVKPGITGWAQINYRYGASIDDTIEKLHFDLYYIQNMSPIIDLDIVIGTMRVVLGAENKS